MPSRRQRSRENPLKQLPRAFAPQVRKRRALHDAELPLRWLSILLRLLEKILPRAARPLRGSPQRGFGDISRRGCLNAIRREPIAMSDPSAS